MNIVNDLMFRDENHLTPREMSILYKLYTYDAHEITTKTKSLLMDDFNFSSKTQIGTYISILFRKGAITKSPVKSWVYHFNPLIIPPKDTEVSQIIINFDGQEKGN